MSANPSQSSMAATLVERPDEASSRPLEAYERLLSAMLEGDNVRRR